MFKSIRARILLILLVVGTSGWYLYQNHQESGAPIKLGLDLQGGMHLVLEIDDPEGTLSMEAKSDAIDRSERVLRNRVDELGVEEPLIQKVGQDRLIVELAGITDEERAKEIIGTTALLEFKLVRPLADIEPYLGRIDRAIVAALGADSLRALGRDLTAPESAVEDLLFGGGTDTTQADTTGAGAEPVEAAPQDPEEPGADLSEEERLLRPFTSLLLSGGEGVFLVATEDYQVARMFLNLPEVEAVLPRTGRAAVQLHFGWQPVGVGGRTYR